MRNKIELIKAPSILGLRPTGVEELPESLLRAGLLEVLDIKSTKNVPPLAYSPKRGSQTSVLNSQAISEYSASLADAVQETIQNDNFPLVLGGDCSIVLGNMLALKRMGRYGLFYADGHADFYQPEASPTGEAADMTLALVSGRGPEVLTNIEGQGPLVKDEDIVLFGQRDTKESIHYGSQQISETSILTLDLDAIKTTGIEKSVREALQLLERRPVRGFWIHVDADVLNDTEMPAVDYRMPGGLRFEDLGTVLNVLLSSDKAIGMDLSIFNPRLDTGGKIAAKLVTSISKGFLKK